MLKNLDVVQEVPEVAVGELDFEALDEVVALSLKLSFGYVRGRCLLGQRKISE